MWAAGALQPYDGLHSDSNDTIWTSSDRFTDSHTDPSFQPEALETASIAENSAKHLWQVYSQDVQTKNPVEKDLIVDWKALRDGCDRSQVISILWQSSYVRWLQQTQGDTKTRSYASLTLRAIEEKSGKKQELQEQQKQQAKQQIL